MWEDAHTMVIPLDNTTLRTHHPLPRDEFFNIMHCQGIKKVELIGVASDYCVTWAGVGFINLGFSVIIKRSLVKGIIREIDQVVTEDGINFTIID